jgi:D-sedoheptulose 7-phosphate isomerase|tara:strand:+ start:5764 stop:6327 length:564 start_codon:yes stop_codon:yes gene_type:complete
MKLIEDTLNEISKNFLELSSKCSLEIQDASKMMIGSLKRGGKIIFCGNGGSAADSQHLSAELVGRYLKNRRPIASISLTTDTSVITAISNDYSFDEIFSRQLEAIGNKNDVLYAISTSGRSKNIIKAINQAKKMGIKIIGITGADGDDMARLCDISIIVPATRPDRIQELHIATGQIICEIIEEELC